MYCDKCIHQDEQTGCCTHDGDKECVEASEFAMKPECMFMALYMLIFNLGGQIEIPEKDFDNFKKDQQLWPAFDTEINKFVLETSHKPKQEKPSMILIPQKAIPNKILKRMVRGRN